MVPKTSDHLPGENPIRSDQSPIRQSFRVSVEPEDKIFAVLNDQTYSVADISPGGINIFCRDSNTFTLSQVIENCKLILPGDTVKGLSAKVVHFSCGPEGRWTHGIQWVDLPDTTLDKIVGQVSKIKKRLRQQSLSG